MLYNDVGVLAGVEIEDVPLTPGAPLTTADLDAACVRAVARGLRPRMLFLLHPDNPLGIVRGAQELRSLLQWVDSNGPSFHLVSDEVYALSVYAEEGEGSAEGGGGGARALPSFPSAARLRCDAAPLEKQYLGSNTHILWGASKDFCASGLRCGVLFSHNDALLAALDNVGYFSAASNSMQDALGAALEDAAWVDSFLAENHRRLREARDLVCTALQCAGVPHVRPRAGLFVWVDLSAWVVAAEAEAEAQAGEGAGYLGERALTEDLFSAGILLTPGEAAHCGKPGWYRICFAWHNTMDCVREG